MLKEIILGYVESIDALREFADSIKLLLQKDADSVLDQEDPGLRKRIERFKGTSETMSQSELQSELDNLFRLMGTSERYNEAIGKAIEHEELLHKSSLITLISTIEPFLSQLLHFHFDRNPGAVQDKSLTLDRLKQLGSIENAQQQLIEEKIEDILRTGLDDWIRFFEGLNLKMEYIDASKATLIEIYQRRNLLVHNGGRVDSKYLSKVIPRLRENISRGDVLNVQPEYLNQAIDLFELSFVLIAAELWKKNEERPDALTGIVYTHLLKERWHIAKELSYFQMGDTKTSENSQIYGRLNYWQSVKWQGRFEDVRKEVEQADFSEKDPLYQLALLALQNKNEDFFSLLPVVLRSEKFTVEDLNVWPIFREMREDPAYRSFIPEPAAERETNIEERARSVH